MEAATPSKTTYVTAKTFILAILTLAIFALSLLGAGMPAAHAAETQDTPTEHIAHFTTIQYKVLPWDDDLWIAMISGEIDAHIPLPAVVEMAVPENTDVYRFGEPGNAPDFTPPWQVRTENGLDIYTAVLTHGHIVTIEYTLPDNPIVRTDAGPAVNVSYTPLHNLDELHLIAALPVDSAVLEPGFEYMGSGPSGEPAFATIVTDAVGGQQYSTSIPYIENASERQSDDNIVAIVGIAGFILLTAIVMFWFFKRGANKDEE